MNSGYSILEILIAINLSGIAFTAAAYGIYACLELDYRIMHNIEQTMHAWNAWESNIAKFFQ